MFTARLLSLLYTFSGVDCRTCAAEVSDMDEDGPGRPLVSTIITTYYRNELLRDAIRSALALEYDPVEVIVVDDSGEGHARPVVDEFEEVVYVPLERNRGVDAARNAGVDRSNGAYVQFLDDDDRLCEDKIERQLPLFDDSVDVVHAGYRIIDTGEVRVPDTGLRGDVVEYALRTRPSPAFCALLIRRTVLERVLPLPDNRGRADIDILVIELGRRTEFEFVPEPLVELRLEEGKEYSLKDYPMGTESRRILLERYRDLYDEYPPDVRREVLTEIHRGDAYHLVRSHWWSPRAIRSLAWLTVNDGERRGTHALTLVAALFGRPGYVAARRMYHALSAPS